MDGNEIQIFLSKTIIYSFYNCLATELQFEL